MNKLVILFCTCCLFFSINTFAGGISLERTRIIYHSASSAVSLSITNTDTDKSKSFIIESWIVTPDNKKTEKLFVAPPLCRIDPK